MGYCSSGGIGGSKSKKVGRAYGYIIIRSCYGTIVHEMKEMGWGRGLPACCPSLLCIGLRVNIL